MGFSTGIAKKCDNNDNINTNWLFGENINDSRMVLTHFIYFK